ncbi:MAG: YggT family protein [Holosporaceae bacterium]|jgi:uncharacterized protein YggT (Ycf19 family)|nr:YggT family protein [Holosporaceae bacterium]
MDIVLVPLLLLLKSVFSLALVIVVVDVVLGWLLVANILNSRNQLLCAIINSISRVSNFMLQPIRKNIPITAGALDISPIVLALFLAFAEHVVDRILIRFI